jgi:hypothetical protein
VLVLGGEEFAESAKSHEVKIIVSMDPYGAQRGELIDQIGNGFQFD